MISVSYKRKQEVVAPDLSGLGHIIKVVSLANAVGFFT
jgi:hypothetical protein